MPNPIESLLMPAVFDRALLMLNHLLSAEPAARERLAPHAGRRLVVEWRVPEGPWPRPPVLGLRVTPAALFEFEEANVAATPGAALHVGIELPAPHRFLMQWLAGERPRVTVDGDAQFAADVAWLADNLRWDAEHDLARFIGDAPAHELMRLGTSLREALRGAAQNVAGRWAGRSEPDAAASR